MNGISVAFGDVGPSRLRKNSGITHDREGHEFYSCRKSRKINAASAAEGLCPRAKGVFREGVVSRDRAIWTPDMLKTLGRSMGEFGSTAPTKAHFHGWQYQPHMKQFERKPSRI